MPSIVRQMSEREWKGQKQTHVLCSLVFDKVLSPIREKDVE